MKNRLFISGLLVFVSLLTFSCTNDDYELPADNNGQLKTITKDKLKNMNEKINAQVQDSTITNTILTEDPATEGDPIIPKPPRKD
ncbi:hypothetical protein GKZ90_0025390 [Flavobacterium sp. MC2016-06]|jgi:hypothetical protein|uniref:hypothetical protein n=1 Tax=Flavobacterium sp. MC2016-06 TaxID=2676308 RepID=UPI0012BA78A4|nr:hypothetical protein [Flavobacterium sp. MC2016-06]MBU3862437.1 hypothetical protein [Flavobacterium sp. MC2016-06]